MTSVPADSMTEQAQRDRAVVWMNRGQVMTRQNPQGALHCYGQAIECLRPLDRRRHPDWSNSLGAALMNHGRLRHELKGIEEAAGVEADYDEAEAVLAEVSGAVSPWILRNRAGVQVNRANLRLDLNESWSAHHFATKALEVIRPLMSLKNVVDLQLHLMAKRCLCDALGQLLPSVSDEPSVTNLAHEAGDHVDDALSLIRQLRGDEEEPFGELSLRFYRFGATLYGQHQPQFLVEFLEEHFVGLKDHAVAQEMNLIALDSISTAMLLLSERVYELSRDLDVMDRARELLISLLEAYERFGERKGAA